MEAILSWHKESSLLQNKMIRSFLKKFKIRWSWNEAKFTSPSLSDDIVINLYEINVFPRSYPFSDFHFNWRYKIWDFWLLFLLFRRRCRTVDPILSKKITLTPLTHRCLGFICLETDQCTIRGACKASSCMYESEKLKERESYITWTFSKQDVWIHSHYVDYDLNRY